MDSAPDLHTNKHALQGIEVIGRLYQSKSDKRMRPLTQAR